MEKKITKKDYFAQIRKILAEKEGTDELIAFVDHEVELLTKKNASRTVKPSKSAMETAEVAKIILNVMPMDEEFTPSGIVALSPELTNTSTPRMTSALKVLIASGLVENVKKGSKSLYRKVAE